MNILSDHADDKMEMLKWLNQKNGDIPIGDLDEMLDSQESDERALDEMLAVYE